MIDFKLQRFAEGDGGTTQTPSTTTPTGANNEKGVRTYGMQFKELLPAVFAKKSYFNDFFVGGLEALDGVAFNKKAFSVKTCDIPVAIGTGYDKTDTKAFKTGTGNSNRFGNRTEITYEDEDVEYTWGWNFHEGIDRHTVNNSLEQAIADRLELQALAKTEMFNKAHGKFISQSACKTITTSATTLSDSDPKALFNELSKYFTNIEAVGTRYAKVTSDLYNLIVDSALATTSKNSSVNIDENGIVKFKGFLIEEVPDSMFQTGEICYAYVGGIAKAFTGINTARTIESEDFDGVALQGAGKAGEYIPTDNKKAVVKIKMKTA